MDKKSVSLFGLFVWLVADGWCWFVLREKYCWLVAGGWFVLREKYCWLVADKPSKQAACFYALPPFSSRNSLLQAAVENRFLLHEQESVPRRLNWNSHLSLVP
jgi:hypothetical protein